VTHKSVSDKEVISVVSDSLAVVVTVVLCVF